MQPLFAYFGGKRRIAPLVWQILGDVDHYLEPFVGSGAVLFARPGTHTGRVETINDADGMVVNVFRALRYGDPAEIQRHTAWPMAHLDLRARWNALHRGHEALRERLIADPCFYDAALAGFYIWCRRTTIGTGMRTEGADEIPALSNHHASCSCNQLAPYAARLAHVESICGDWHRMLGGVHVSSGFNSVGLFFDPPYEGYENVYSAESTGVSAAVRAWCRQHGEKYRIVLCGYGTEHDALCAHGWRVHAYTARRGYQHANRVTWTSERLWISPACHCHDLLTYAATGATSPPA